MSKRPLSGGKLPRRQTKTSKISLIRGLNVQLEEARKDAANLKKAIGDIATMCLDEVADIKEALNDLEAGENWGTSDPNEFFEPLIKLLNGLRSASEVTIA